MLLLMWRAPVAAVVLVPPVLLLALVCFKRTIILIMRPWPSSTRTTRCPHDSSHHSNDHNHNHNQMDKNKENHKNNRKHGTCSSSYHLPVPSAPPPRLVDWLLTRSSRGLIFNGLLLSRHTILHRFHTTIPCTILPRLFLSPLLGGLLFGYEQPLWAIQCWSRVAVQPAGDGVGGRATGRIGGGGPVEHPHS